MVEQVTADDEAPYARKAQVFSHWSNISSGRSLRGSAEKHEGIVVASATRSISSTTGTFSHVCEDVAPRALATAIERITPAAAQVVLNSSIDARLMKGSNIAMRLAAAERVTAFAQDSRCSRCPRRPD